MQSALICKVMSVMDSYCLVWDRAYFWVWALRQNKQFSQRFSKVFISVTLSKCQLTSCNSLEAWESSSAFSPSHPHGESRGWGSWAPRLLCWWDHWRWQTGACGCRQTLCCRDTQEVSGSLKFMVWGSYSVKKNPRAKKRIEGSSPRPCLAGAKGELPFCQSHSLLWHQVLFVFYSRPWRKWSEAHADSSGI